MRRVPADTEEVARPPAPTPERPTRAASPQKPGCLAADRTILAYGQIMGLAQGWGGFGVMRQTAELLQDATRAARIMREPALADNLEAVLESLPDIRDEQGARAAADRLEPLVREAWKLGVRCGRTAAAMNKALAALDAIKAGRIRPEGSG